MKTVLHIASVFPAASNRLALQFSYVDGTSELTLLHLTARAEDLSEQETGGIRTLVLPHKPAPRHGDRYLTRRARSLLRRMLNWVALARILADSDADVLHAHENSALVALAIWVLLLRRRAIWDPHDFFHDHGKISRPLRTRMLQALERAVAAAPTPILTVSEGMTANYRRLYPRAKFVLIRNYSSHRGCLSRKDRDPAEIATRLIRQRNHLANGKIRLVYPGLIKPGRFELSLIERLGTINTVTLDIYGEDRTGSAGHRNALTRLLRERRIGNVRLKGGYSSDQIIPTLEQYHFAIFPFLITRPNIDFCLPNKFFQCVEAGLPMIITNMKEMSAIFREYGLGYVYPAGDNDAAMDVLNTCDASGEDYAMLVRNVLTYRDTQVDFRAQRALLLRAYSGGRGEIPE